MNKIAIAVGLAFVGVAVAVPIVMPETFTVLLSAVQTVSPAAPPVATTNDEACDRLLAQVLNPNTPLEEFDRIEAELLQNNCGG